MNGFFPVGALRSRPFFHVCSWLFLAFWDLQVGARRRLSRSLVRILAGFLAFMLAALLLTSIYGLSKIGAKMQSLQVDSLVGLEVAVETRAAVREFQLSLLRQAPAGHDAVKYVDIQDFKVKIGRLLDDYRAGIFDEGDFEHANAMEDALKDLLDAVGRIVTAADASPELFDEADVAAQKLIVAIGQGYEFNRERLRAAADEASEAAHHALRVTKILWAGGAVFLAALGGLFAIDRWLTKVESDGSTR